jgi:hypothetical protein
MSVPIQLIVSAGGWAGCAVSIYFNVRQHYRLKRQSEEVRQEKVERERKEQEAQDEQRKREQAPPDFYNFDGTSGPIVINGSQHSSQVAHLWGVVTVVNPTDRHMKITPIRLVIAGEEWPFQSITFQRRSFTEGTFDRISLVGNDKEDYELHFRVPENKCPTGDGELWLASSNRAEQFLVSVRFP